MPKNLAWDCVASFLAVHGCNKNFKRFEIVTPTFIYLFGQFYISDTKPIIKSNNQNMKMLAPLIEADEASQMYISENVDEVDDDEESPPIDHKEEECHVISNKAASGYTNETAYKLNETEFSTISQQVERKSSGPLFKVNGAAVADRSNFESVCATKSSKSNAKKKKNRFRLVSHPKPSKKREKNAARRERKATKTLAIVLGKRIL